MRHRGLLTATITSVLLLSAPVVWACTGLLEMADCCQPASPMHEAGGSGCHDTEVSSMECCPADSAAESTEPIVVEAAKTHSSLPAARALVVVPSLEVTPPGALPAQSGPGHGPQRCALLSSFLL
ncbi:MAG: hypothetical protein ACE5EG_09485 [Thermoanaerobaculia bacterium]